MKARTVTGATIGRRVGRMIPFAILGSFLLFLFGCRVALLLYAPSAAAFALLSLRSTSRMGTLPNNTRLRELARGVSSLLLATSDFGLPLLVLFRREGSGSPAEGGKEVDVTSFESLVAITSFAAVSNLWVSVAKFGVGSFPWGILGLAMAGTQLGVAIRKIPLIGGIPSDESSETLYRACLFVLPFLAAVSFLFMPVILPWGQ